MVPVCQHQTEVQLVDPVRRKTSTECTPLLGKRPLRKGNGINLALISLGILLIGGLSIGSYLLMKDNHPFTVALVFDMVDRIAWSDDSVSGSALKSSDVQNIYLMQTNSPECHNYIECVAIIQKMQMISKDSSYGDIPYNFLIAGDGVTYEARGWSKQSGFSFVTRNSSLTIGIIGTFNYHPPPDRQLREANALINESLRRHKIIRNYQIYGIRNISISKTDGQSLFNKISRWDHWNSTISIS